MGTGLVFRVSIGVAPHSNGSSFSAARRFGIKTFVLPALNEPDLTELPDEVRRDMTFVPAETLEQVLKVAFEGSLVNSSSGGR